MSSSDVRLSTATSLSSPLMRRCTTEVSPCAGGDSDSQPERSEPAATAPPAVMDAPTTNVRRLISGGTAVRLRRLPEKEARLRTAGALAVAHQQRQHPAHDRQHDRGPDRRPPEVLDVEAPVRG